MSGHSAPTASVNQSRGHCLAVFGMVGLIAFLALPVLAQDGTGPVPENAEARSYGGGWDCRLGYRVDGTDCVANGFSTQVWLRKVIGHHQPIKSIPAARWWRRWRTR